MTLTSKVYHCCFCGKQGLVQFEDYGVETERFIAFLPKNIACDGCASFHRGKKEVSGSIAVLASKWMAVPVIKRTHEIEQELRGRLDLLFRKLCSVYEDFYRVGGLYDPIMVDAVVNDPKQTNFVFHQISKTAKGTASTHTPASGERMG